MQARPMTTEEFQAQYEADLSRTTKNELVLARLLQRAGFPERRFDKNFLPAPLYVRQALALSRDDVGSMAQLVLDTCRGSSHG